MFAVTEGQTAATRPLDEAAFYRRMQELAWAIIDTAFSNAVITAGATRTDDVVWWFRQRVNDLGPGTWCLPGRQGNFRIREMKAASG
jgi:hypothetical protein